MRCVTMLSGDPFAAVFRTCVVPPPLPPQVREVEAQLRAEGVGRAVLADVVRRVQEQEREKLHLSPALVGRPIPEASPPEHAAPGQGLPGMPAPLQGIPPEAAAAAFTATRRAGGCGCGHSSSSSTSNAAGGGTGSGAVGHGEEDGEGEWEEQCAVARLDAEYDAAVAQVRQALARIVGDINEALEEVRYEVAELEGEADAEDAA
ncbi:unnamed protein product [Closterium sp. Yama58-4]|nr:unnamed protein product [Closterium sp. Yama58-4]